MEFDIEFNDVNQIKKETEKLSHIKTDLIKHFVQSCNDYLIILDDIIPLLEKYKKVESLHTPNQQLLAELYKEGQDHHYNLTQLKKEASHINNKSITIEISSEVLDSASDYLMSLASKIESTDLYKKFNASIK